MQDVLWGFETGKLSEGELPFAIDLAQLRFFYPQLWLQATLDKENILQQYLAKDFTEFDSRPVPAAYVFSRMFLPAMGNVGNKFYSLTACVLAMQALLRAEEHRRKYGEYPETLSNLPIDPFSGKPMLYRYGTTDVTELVLQLTEVPSMTKDEPSHKHYESTSQSRQAKVVQVWSVGHNGQNEGGISGATINGKDDPCARIRLE